MNWRNRIAGGVAVAIGFAVVAILVIEGRWDNHDTVKPLKALLGSFVFIIMGAWYLIRGEKAESPKQQEIVVQRECDNHTKIHLDLKELEKAPSFQAECRKVEHEMRKKAEKMERDARL